MKKKQRLYKPTVYRTGACALQAYAEDSHWSSPIGRCRPPNRRYLTVSKLLRPVCQVRSFLSSNEIGLKFTSTLLIVSTHTSKLKLPSGKTKSGGLACTGCLLSEVIFFFEFKIKILSKLIKRQKFWKENTFWK